MERLTGHRLYTIWSNMKQRCLNSKAHEYSAYGGRGITVCDEWRNSFKPFYDWAMANGYRDDLTIDRINNDGNYEPDNCRWATREQQYANRRLRKLSGRDKKRQVAWAKEKYTQLKANIDKPVAEKFKAKLKKEKRTFQGWLKEKIKQYLGE